MINHIIHHVFADPVNNKDNLKSWENTGFTQMFWNDYSSGINEQFRTDHKNIITAFEKLHEFGGIYIDHSIKSVDNLDMLLTLTPNFMLDNYSKKVFGFVKNDPGCLYILNELKKTQDINISDIVKNGNIDIKLIPSYKFIPYTNEYKYTGHNKVYAYDTSMCDTLPSCLTKPNDTVSLLIINSNTVISNIEMCVRSILNQECNLFIEIVWVNDKKSEDIDNIKKMLIQLEMISRFVIIKYIEPTKRLSKAKLLKCGYSKCTSDIIFRLDLKDLMANNRLDVQYSFMKQYDKLACICYANAFVENTKNVVDVKSVVTLPVNNLVNTMCIKKSALPYDYNNDNDILDYLGSSIGVLNIPLMYLR